ncbi:MAG: hypothetical protein LW832_05175 [Parachlamydia sp.]|jgi:hypothetical protein|nr:hypothetical protein [Parachlamydia sp.]
MTNQEKIHLSFHQQEEATSIFLFEDLVKEYNTQVINSPPYLKKYPLTLHPIDTKVNSIVRPMTKAEIESMKPFKFEVSDEMRLKKNFK